MVLGAEHTQGLEITLVPYLDVFKPNKQKKNIFSFYSWATEAQRN